MSDLALVEKLERTLIHVWPSVETEMHGPWALRFAHGYSARANSTSALSQDATIDEELLHRTGTFFDGHKLPAQFRISPLANARSIAVLQSAGYSFKDEAVTMIAALSPYEMHPTVTIAPLADDVWLEGVTALNADNSKRGPGHLKSITTRMEPPVAFATTASGGKIVGYAICAIHDGWAELGSIIVAPEARGNGLGRALVTSLLHWASANGAANAFLQVDLENGVAISLYRSLGFADCYRYSTWRKHFSTV
jgi:ribosomal protein S18 acetylase RimI-like enzyme